MLVHFKEGVAAVVVVGVDDSERLFYGILAAVDRVPSAEGLVPTRRENGNVLQHVFRFNRLCNAVSDKSLEILLHILAENEYGFIKARFLCVVYGKVENVSAVPCDRFGLFESAEAATHARRHHDERRFFDHFFFSC